MATLSGILRRKAVIWGVCLFSLVSRAKTQQPQPLVRLAQIEVDPPQLAAYNAALKDEIATSIRIEPGVITLYAVSLKEHPEQIRLFEAYRDQAAYNAHIQSPHFRLYKSRTQNMVRSLTLLDADPILLGTKSVTTTIAGQKLR